MTKISCPKCEKGNEEDAKFCNNCGFDFITPKKEIDKDGESVEKDRAPKKGVNKNVTYGIIIVILAILAFVTIYLITLETRSVPYQESYQDPIYRTEYYQDTIYKTEYYEDAIYKTEYYQDPVYVTQTYTRSCGFLLLKTCSDQRQVVDHYETRSRQVFDHNEIKPRQVFDHYETKQRQVFDHYVTKYETKYKDVTKKRYEWLMN